MAQSIRRKVCHAQALASVFSVAIGFGLSTAASPCLAQPAPASVDPSQSDVSASPQLEEAYGDAFVNYQDHVSPKKPQAKAPGILAPAAAAAVAPPKKTQVDVAWLRKNYPLLEERAIDNPTQENVSSYLYVKRVVLDKAQRFSEAVNDVTNRDPLLNENNRIPYASTGAKSVANANYQAQQDAVRELARVGGLLIFVDGACRFCAAQLPIASMVKHQTGMEYLVISTDGAVPKGYSGQVLPDNGLFKKLGLQLTPSTVFVPAPKSYATAADPNRYLVVAQGFYAADEFTKQIAFAGHATQLLSPRVMADLDVWDRGVASTADLTHLALDPDRPADIKRTLEPLLLRQYREPRETKESGK